MTKVDCVGGKLKTELTDFELIALVMREWAQLPAKEIEGNINELKVLDQGTNWLEKSGYPLWDFTFTERIILKKVGEGEWIVEGYNFEEMEEFVESVSGNLDDAEEKNG